MQNITRNILAKLRLAPDSSRGRRREVPHPAENPQATDTLETPAAAAPRAPAAKAAPGLSARDALAVLKRAERLPSSAPGWPRNHVKSLLKNMEPADRASVVEGASLLLPVDADAALFHAVVDYLRTLSPQDRSVLGHVMAGMADRTRLASGADAFAYVDLLKTVHGLPAAHRAPLLKAARESQSVWTHSFPAHGWDQLLQAFAAGPIHEVARRAREIRTLYVHPRNDQNKVSDFLKSATAHLSLDAADRSIVLNGCRELFGSDHRQAHTGRALFARELVQAPPAERTARIEVLRALRQGVNLILTPWVVQEAQEPFAQPLRDPVERRECIDMVRAAPLAEGHEHNAWLLMRTLVRVPRAERSMAMALARAALARGVFGRVFAENDIVAATPEARRDHLARLGGGRAASRRPAARAGGAEDLENVMQGALRQQVDQAEARLRTRLGRRIPVREALRALEQHLSDLKETAQDHPGSVLLRQRGGDAEVNNALRTLVGASRPGDFSRAVRSTPEMAALCALIWHATSAPRPGVGPAQAARERDLMRHGMAMALARCIEDDGHRVCGVGQRQYLVDVLKGYYPEAGDAQASVTPRSLVTVLAEDFYKSHQNQADAAPTAEQVAAFKTRARAVATERFGARTPDMADFSEQFDAYMRMTY